MFCSLRFYLKPMCDDKEVPLDMSSIQLLDKVPSVENNKRTLCDLNWKLSHTWHVKEKKTTFLESVIPHGHIVCDQNEKRWYCTSLADSVKREDWLIEFLIIIIIKYKCNVTLIQMWKESSSETRMDHFTVLSYLLWDLRCSCSCSYTTHSLMYHRNMSMV